MTPRLRAAGVAAGAIFLLAAAGCGGGGSNGVKGAQMTLSPKAQIRQNWLAFFDGSTPAAQKAKLLQNGQRFSSVIKIEASSPLAKKTAAKVKSVTMQGPSRATVVYSVLVAGKPALTNRTGEAVKTGGVWKVGDQSFCALLGLQGSPPAGCSK